MKRALVAILVAGAVFGGVFAFAASLTVNSDNLGAGNADVDSCDEDSVDASYTVAYDAAKDFWKVTHIVVSNVNVLCNGETLSATLTDGAGASIGTASATVALTSGSQSFAVSTVDPDGEGGLLAPAALDAELVEDIHVVITGANA